MHGKTAPPSAQLSAPEPAARKGSSHEPTGYRRVFAVAEFRFVFAAHALSLLGVVVSELALTVLVYGLTGSPLLSSLVLALGFLPHLVGGALLSGVADQYPPRGVLVVCDLLCAACAGAMALPGTPIAVLLVLRCLIAVTAPVFTGTRTATLADILGDGDLFVLGRSLLRIVSQGALLIGFGLGGVLLTVVSPRGALVVTVCTFASSALLLRFGTRRRPAWTGKGALVRNSLSGTRQVLEDRRTRAVLLLTWGPPLFVVAPEALAAAFADEIGVGAAGVGLLMCAMPVGTIAGELIAGALFSPAARARITLPLAASGLLPLLAVPVLPGLGWVLLALALTGIAGAYTLGLDQWFVRAVPEELRGRAMTAQTAGLMTTQGGGMALAGAAAEFWPVSVVVCAAGASGTVCCVLLALHVLRTGERPDR
ncbi:MFS transporter [Streptomyces sp. NPDC001381]|uniref:MFS transporter n=1 Tax=Streptomyces sp. NPDC001381 TaxID=3364567 RepID=UPI00369E5727